MDLKNQSCSMLTTFLISGDKNYIDNYKKKYDGLSEIIKVNITNINSLYVLKSHSPLNIATTWKSDYDYDILEQDEIQFCMEMDNIILLYY